MVRTENDHAHRSVNKRGIKGRLTAMFARWEHLIELAIQRVMCGMLNWVMGRRILTVCTAVLILVVVVGGLGPRLRREFFPEVDAGSFEIYVRGATGTRIEATEERIAKVEQYIRDTLKR